MRSTAEPTGCGVGSSRQLRCCCCGSRRRAQGCVLLPRRDICGNTIFRGALYIQPLCRRWGGCPRSRWHRRTISVKSSQVVRCIQSCNKLHYSQLLRLRSDSAAGLLLASSYCTLSKLDPQKAPLRGREHSGGKGLFTSLRRWWQLRGLRAFGPSGVLA